MPLSDGDVSGGCPSSHPCHAAPVCGDNKINILTTRMEIAVSPDHLYFHEIHGRVTQETSDEHGAGSIIQFVG
jgi:hypothetical protein